MNYKRSIKFFSQFVVLSISQDIFKVFSLRQKMLDQTNCEKDNCASSHKLVHYVKIFQ